MQSMRSNLAHLLCLLEVSYIICHQDQPQWPNLFPTPPEVLGFQMHRISVDPGVHLSVVERQGINHDSDPIVFVHGYGDSWRSFQRLFPMMDMRHRIISLDLRGFGDSSKPHQSMYGSNLWAADLHKVLKALAVDRIKCLVGHSTGSFVAWHYAGKWPERVEKLVLIGTGSKQKATPANAAAFMKQLEELPGRITYDFAAQITAGTINKAAAGQFFWDTCIYQTMQSTVLAWKAALRGSESESLSFDLARELLPKIGATTLLMRGESDPLFSHSDLMQVKQFLKVHTSIVEIPGEGHSPHWTTRGAPAVMAALDYFLEDSAGLASASIV